jgi:inosine-uridine nucleoside N-ribohydrolase
MHEQHKILVDTDPGVDDAMALAFLSARPDVRIAAITTVFGNADVDTTTRNARYLAARFAIDAPIFAGAARPLLIDRPYSPVRIHGKDGLGDVLSLENTTRATEAVPAHERIVEMVRRSPHQLSILSLGPLTNLALALKLDPGIASLVSRVIIMGGAFGWGHCRGNVSPVAEANVRNDPHAADAVLAAPWPVIVVGLDVTARCILTTAQARQLADEAGDTGRLLWDISRSYEAMYRKLDGIDGCCLHDVAAAACVVEPSLFQTSAGPMRVVTEGIAVGQTIMRAPGRSFPTRDWDDIPSHQACRDVDVARLVQVYSDALIGRAAGISNRR